MAKLPYLSHEPPKTWQDANRIAASKMAMQGFPVFPCYAFGQDKSGRNLAKRPVGPWKHWKPRAAQEIADLWRGEWSEYLPAISLEAHDLVVFDPDVREACNGLEAWEKLCLENPLPAGVPLVSTAGGGLHAYFKQRPDFKLGNGEGSLPKGIDVRGLGGLVIAPGAMLPDGRQWAYREGTVFRSAPVIPDWLFNMVRGEARETLTEFPRPLTEPIQNDQSDRYWTPTINKIISTLASMQPETGRNNALNNAAFDIGQMIPYGAIDRATLINRLVEASYANGSVRDHTMKQVMQTIMSGLGGAERKPRAAPDIKLNHPRLEAPTCHGAAIGWEAPKYSQEEIKSAIEALPLVWAGELLDTEAPVREWLVKDWIPLNQVHLLSGDGGIGKSTLALQLAAAVATGTPWVGLETRKGRTLVISAEDDLAEMHYRLEGIIEGIEGEYQEKKAAFDNIALVDVTSDLDSTLASYDAKTAAIAPAPLFDRVVKAIYDHGFNVIIIDSLADVFPEELHRHAVRSFLRKLRTFGCTIIILGHPSVSGIESGRGYSGSTHWSNGVRSRSYFSRFLEADADEDLRKYALPKSNRSKANQEVILRWTKNGFIIEKNAEANIAPFIRQLKVQEVFLKLLRQFTLEGRPVRPNVSRSGAPHLFAEHPDNEGFNKDDFNKSMNVLLRDGKIEAVPDGPPSNNTQRIIEKKQSATS